MRVPQKEPGLKKGMVVTKDHICLDNYKKMIQKSLSYQMDDIDTTWLEKLLECVSYGEEAMIGNSANCEMNWGYSRQELVHLPTFRQCSSFTDKVASRNRANLWSSSSWIQTWNLLAGIQYGLITEPKSLNIFQIISLAEVFFLYCNYLL